MVFINEHIELIILYLVVINIIAFSLYGIDKGKAKAHMWRIPEATLLLLAALGGSIGALFGMHVFHHKTRKAKFFIGVPLILILQLCAVAFIYFKL